MLTCAVCEFVFDETFFKMIYMHYEPLSKGECEGMRRPTRLPLTRLPLTRKPGEKCAQKHPEHGGNWSIRCPPYGCLCHPIDPLWQTKLKTNVAHLTLNEVRHLTHLASVLAPLADLTEKLQEELGNLRMILPAVTEIKSLLTNDGTRPIGITAFAETLANNLSARYGGYYTDKHISVRSPSQGRIDHQSWVCVQLTRRNPWAPYWRNPKTGDTWGKHPICSHAQSWKSRNWKRLACLYHTSLSSSAYLEMQKHKLKCTSHPPDRTRMQKSFSFGKKTPNLFPAWQKQHTPYSASQVTLLVMRGCCWSPLNKPLQSSSVNASLNLK